ncbi:MAG: TMEM175 family protein, partial [Candidatus Paceibacterales bacterium]
NNHHHLLRATKHVSASIMWANLHLLFWLSIIPFATGWLGANHNAPTPTAFYAGVLLCCAFAYLFLQEAVIFHSERRIQIRKELYKQKKGLVSLICYALAIPLAFINPIFSDVLIVAVSLLWFIPDKRIERALGM